MGLRTAFHRSRFHPIGALPHPVGGYRPQQRVKQCDHDSTLSEDQSGSKAVDGLQGTFDLYSAYCRKGWCGHVRQNLPPGHANFNRRLFLTTLAIK